MAIKLCRRRWQRLAGSLLGCALLMLGTGCAEIVKPDLQRLYRASAKYADQPPVIVVHGVLGSRLRDPVSGREAWPGGIGRLAFSDFADLALEIDPETLEPKPGGLVPYAIFDRALGQDFYGEILRTLEVAGGFHKAEAGKKPPPRPYYVFLYDWRRDNVESVNALDAYIEQVRRDHGDPRLKVDLVAHSNGGLISRYFLRYGATDVCNANDFPVTQAGAEKVRRLILLGTPNFGSVSAVTGFIEGTTIGFGKVPPEVLATMPSAYQLFPHALNDWLLSGKGEPLQRDLYDVEIWRRFQWSIFDPEVRERVIVGQATRAQGEQRLAMLERFFERRLERARRFTWSLTVPIKDPKVLPIVFGGDCELTPARLVVEDIDDDSQLRLWPKQIENPAPGVDYEALMLEPGDGTVTKASLLARESLDPSVPRHRYSYFAHDYTFFLCESHERLTGNPTFQDNLLHALLIVDPQ